jgi:hypothetical protein
MTNALAYCTMLAVALAAYFGLPWYVFLCGAGVLTLIAVIEQQRYRPRLADIGMTDFLHTTAMASATNGLLASGASYGLGLIVRSVFGG